MHEIMRDIEVAAPLNFYVVKHRDGVLMTDKDGRRFRGGASKTLWVALFTTKEAARKAAKNARNFKPYPYRQTRIARCALVMPTKQGVLKSLARKFIIPIPRRKPDLRTDGKTLTGIKTRMR